MMNKTSRWSPCRMLRLVYVCFIAAGCVVGPNYKRSLDPLPDTFTEDPLADTVAVADVKLGEAQHFEFQAGLMMQWWELFQSEALNALVESSLRENPTVEVAQATLSFAIENVYAQIGFYYPTLTGDFIPTRQKTSPELASNTANNAYYYSLYTAQLSISYTADVFGANRRQVESLRALADAASFNLEATYLTLTTNVVNAAIAEAGLRGQIAATREIIAIQSKLLNLFQQLYDLGQISLADVTTQEAALAAVEATLPILEKQLAVERDLLKTLVGRFPNDKETATFTLDSLQLPTELPLSLPSVLVENRPDVRAAEEQLHSACALVGVAITNRLPTITLGVNTIGSAATSWSDLFTSQSAFWGLAGGLLQPIFDGGTLMHRELAARATYREAAAQYRLTVLTAFQNVADALQAIKFDALALQASKKAERAAATSLEIQRAQLAAGDINIVLLLAAEQAYQQALLNLVQAQVNRLADTVALFQALGGGWWNTGQCADVPGCDGERMKF